MKAPSKSKRLGGEALKLRDAEWLRLAGLGFTPAEIADRFGVSRQLVNRRLRLAKRARDEERGPDVGDAESAVDAKAEGPPLPWWLDLVPLFPIGPFTPRSECPHRCRRCDGSGVVEERSADAAGTIVVKAVECPSCRGVPRLNAGTLLCCMVCSRSGMDDHPALRRDPKLDPAPEPPPKSPASAAVGRGRKGPKGEETRRESRARKFGRVA